MSIINCTIFSIVLDYRRLGIFILHVFQNQDAHFLDVSKGLVINGDLLSVK